MPENELLVASNIVKTYGKKQALQTVLHGVSLSINRGESVAIIGKSGSGKSTLMHILSGLDNEYQGEVALAGQKLNQMNDKQLDELRGKKVGFIFQTFYVQPNNTVLENVALPLSIMGVPHAEQISRAMETLKAVGLEEKAKQKAKDLSGGQKQRVCIARALVNNPNIIFADEPVGNLDSVTGQSIEDQLFELNKRGVTLVIVTHDEDLAARCSGSSNENYRNFKKGQSQHLEP
jgi:putative ABC transport system ATP-binding protein